jgi:hypothetical protein
MKRVIAKLKSTAPYSQSRAYQVEKLQGEGADDYALRTWRNYMHADKDGNVFIPNGSFKNCLSEAAKFMSISIPGKGKATYTKNFEAGVMVGKSPFLGVNSKDIEFERLFLPADGRRGSGKRVWKYYPLIPEWEAEVEFLVLDDTVLQSSVKDKKRTVFEDVLEGAGQFIGIGRFRPRNNGYYGRFEIVEFAIKD